AIQRTCRGATPAQFPITDCPLPGVDDGGATAGVDDLAELVGCVQAIVGGKVDELIGSGYGIPVRCGDGVRQASGKCDGADASACPGQCTAQCTCADDVGRCVGEDGGSCRTDADCPGRCNLEGELCLTDGDCGHDHCGRCRDTDETCSTDADCVQANV